MRRLPRWGLLRAFAGLRRTPLWRLVTDARARSSWLFLPVRPDYVFPLAAIAVGTHYFAFRTVYGDALYWVLGGLITAAGLAGIWGIALPSGGVIFAVAAIEIIFGFVLTWRATR